jgi:hypothetical protein
MADRGSHQVWDERKAFRVARRAGRRHPPAPATALGIAAFIIGLEVFVVFRVLRMTFVENTLPLYGLVFMPVAVLIAVLVVRYSLRETPVLRGIRRAWRRAKHGDVARVLTGVALRQGQSVGRFAVRTVVAHVDGRTRFVRLAFARAEDAARFPAGPVQVDVFDAPALHGPARLRSLHGAVAWAFAVRNGDFAAAEGTPWTFEDGWSDAWPDGWPDSDGAAESTTGWPGDSGGDGDGDGDGDGGE